MVFKCEEDGRKEEKREDKEAEQGETHMRHDRRDKPQGRKRAGSTRTRRWKNHGGNNGERMGKETERETGVKTQESDYESKRTKCGQKDKSKRISVEHRRTREATGTEETRLGSEHVRNTRRDAKGRTMPHGNSVEGM